jgi:hypothetical protein
MIRVCHNHPKNPVAAHQPLHPQAALASKEREGHNLLPGLPPSLTTCPSNPTIITNPSCSASTPHATPRHAKPAAGFGSSTQQIPHPLLPNGHKCPKIESSK